MFYDLITKYSDIFCWKNERSLNFLHYFNKKYWHISDTYLRNFKEMLTDNVVSFEQLGPDVIQILHWKCLKHFYVMHFIELELLL